VKNVTIHVWLVPVLVKPVLLVVVIEQEPHLVLHVHPDYMMMVKMRNVSNVKANV